MWYGHFRFTTESRRLIGGSFFSVSRFLETSCNNRSKKTCLQEAAGGSEEFLEGVWVEGHDPVLGVLDVRSGENLHQLRAVELVRVAVLEIAECVYTSNATRPNQNDGDKQTRVMSRGKTCDDAVHR